MNALILQPLVAYIGLLVYLYMWLTGARQRAVSRGEAQMSTYVLGRDEPIRVARITRNLANQFELPPLFFACIALLAVNQAVTWFDVWMAWLFVAGRVVHTLVQTKSDDVVLRGRVFVISFSAFIGIAAHLALVAAGLGPFLAGL